MKLPALSIIRIARAIVEEHRINGADPSAWDDCLVEIDEAVRALVPIPPEAVPAPKRTSVRKRRPIQKGIRAEILRFMHSKGGACSQAEIEIYLINDRKYDRTKVQQAISRVVVQGCLAPSKNDHRVFELTEKGWELARWFADHPTRRLKRDPKKRV
jgi:predicted transcriptional regulator